MGTDQVSKVICEHDGMIGFFPLVVAEDSGFDLFDVT